MEGLGSPTSLPPDPTVNQGVKRISTNNGDLSIAGRDVFIHKHYYGPHPDHIDIISALRAVRNLRKVYLDILSKATAGTGIWLFKTKQWLLWLDLNGNLNILWGTGIPGAGKSVLASIAIRELEARAAEANGNICVAYAFIRYSDAADMTVRHVLEILVKQTVERHSNCAAAARQVYARHLSEDTQPSEEELLELLRQCAEMKTATFYIIDALDEAPDKLQLELVKKLASLNVRLLITSRPLKTVEARAPDAYRLTINAQDHDLELHIAQGIDRSPDLEVLLQRDPSLRAEVAACIKDNCGGMFLHASLQLDALCQSISMQDVRETLNNFPSSIEDVYLRTWQRIISQTPRLVGLAKLVLACVVNASRSMKLEELECVVATSPSTHKFEHGRVVAGSTLLALCRGLVVHEEESRIVRLVHYTAKVSLQRLLAKSFPEPHSHLATVCMTHLAERGLQNSTITSQEDFTAALKQDALLAYATDAWAFHAHQCLGSEGMKQRTAKFVAESQAFPAFTEPNYPAYFDLLSPLHILAQYNFPLELLEHGVQDPNIQTKLYQSTPLVLASWYGHTGFVRDLLELPDIQPNLTDNANWSPLLLAICDNFEEIVALLIARADIQVNHVNNEGVSALLHAASRGNQRIVKLLLSRPEIDINSVSNTGRSALMWATCLGYAEVVELLLAIQGIEVNLTDADGRSALIWAAALGHERIAKLLLAIPGIKVNLITNQGFSALIEAARGGHAAIMQEILAHPDVQVNLATDRGFSALLLAASAGHSRVVELLLPRPEIDVNSVEDHGYTALMLSSQTGDTDTVKLLLSRSDIDVNLVNEDGNSALKLAISTGRDLVVRKLLAFPNIDTTIKNKEGYTALTAAMACGLDVMVRLLRDFEDRKLGQIFGPSAFGDASTEFSGAPLLASAGDQEDEVDGSDSEGLETYQDAEEWFDEYEQSEA